MQIAGTVALVTGGASGLGRATTDALIARGATVVVLDRAGAVARLTPSEALVPVAGDITDAATIEAALSRARELGRLGACVNCAGIDGPERTAVKGIAADLDTFRRVVEVNLVGTFNVIRLVAAAMQQHDAVDGERGVIVNTASIAAFDGQMGQASYAASKGGLTAMTLPIARDLASSAIRCVTIAPGLFDTPLLNALPEAVVEKLGAAVPHPRRLGDTREFAAFATHVIENPYVNGEVLRIDGALRLAGPR